MKLRSNKTTLNDVQENRTVKLEHKDFPDSNDACTSQTSSRKFPGVGKFKGGYCARIKDPVTKKQLWLGTFKSPEEASMAYLAKKTELEKKQGISGVGCGEGIKKVVVDGSGGGLGGGDDCPCEGNQESSLQIGSRKSRMGKRKGSGHSSRRKIGGVSKSKQGKYVARVTHPVTKKRIWLGSFGSVEEASAACLAKSKELEEELCGEGKGIQGGVCDEEIKVVVDQLGECLENKESLLQIGTPRGRISKKKKRNQDSLLEIGSGEEGVSKKKRENQDSSLQIDSRKEGVLENDKVVDQSGQRLVVNGTDIGEENQESSLQIDSRKEGISEKNQDSSLQIGCSKEGISKNNKVVDQSGQCLVENGTNTCEENRESSLQGGSGKEGISKNKKVVIDQSGQCLVENGANTCEEKRESPLQIDSRKARTSKKKKKGNQDSSLQIDARKARISKKKKKCLAERMIVGYVGVSQSKSGKYVARITHPISKKKIWLGTFGSAEEASMAYLTKKTELQKEVQGKEGVEKNPHLVGPISEESNHHPCSDNRDSAMKIEPIDSLNGQSASRMEDLPIQLNVASAEKELSVVSESGAEILLRTESGAPLMDSHGFLLGSWSWIDDLSLPIV